MPILLLAAPLYLWLNLCALQWVHNQAESKSFGETLASEILIQQPLSMFNGIGLGLMWVISVVVSFDLQCSLVTIVLFSIFFLSQLVCSVFMKSILHAMGDADTHSSKELQEISVQDPKLELNQSFQHNHEMRPHTPVVPLSEMLFSCDNSQKVEPQRNQLDSAKNQPEIEVLWSRPPQSS